MLLNNDQYYCTITKSFLSVRLVIFLVLRLHWSSWCIIHAGTWHIDNVSLANIIQPMTTATMTYTLASVYMTPGRGGEHSRTWRGWWISALLAPISDIFLSHWVPFYVQLDLIDPLFLLCLSLSHLFPEIIWPKVGIFFHKYLSFDTFEAICTNFLLDFRSCWSTFHCYYIVLTPHFYKTLDPVGSIFSLPAGPPLTKYLVKCLPLWDMTHVTFFLYGTPSFIWYKRLNLTIIILRDYLSVCASLHLEN